MEIKIKNYQTREFTNFLHGLEIKGAKLSRMRTRLLRDVSTYVAEKLVPELKEIAYRYAELKDDGEPMTDGYGNIEWRPEVFEKAMKEMEEIDNEYYYLKCDSFMKKAIISIGEFLLENEDIVLEGNTATFFDGWCEEFEKALEYYAKKEVEEEED